MNTLTSVNIRNAMLRRDFHSFFARAFREVNANTALRDNWHLEAITRALSRVQAGDKRFLVIAVPPRSGKSLMTSVAFPAYLLGCNPNERILCISHSKDLATKFGRQCRQVMESAWYRQLFPGTRLLKSSEDLIETDQGGHRMAASIETGITGHGGMYILIDDPLAVNDHYSSAAVEKVNLLYREAIYTRLDDKQRGRIVLTMQRLADNDLAGLLLAQPQFSELVLPALATEDAAYEIWNGWHQRRVGDLLHPERESQAELDMVRGLMSSETYAAQYQQAPVPSVGKHLRSEWIKEYTPPLRTDGMRVVISVDTAIKGLPTSDYSVATVWAEKDDQHYLIDVYRAKVDLPRLVDDMAALHAKYRADYILIEEQGSGSSLAAYLKLRQIQVTTIRARGDKETRFSKATYYFDRGQVFFPTHAPWLADMKSELLTFPDRCKHDDQVDSVSQYINWSHDRGRGSFFYHSPFDLDPDPSPETLMQVLSGVPRF